METKYLLAIDQGTTGTKIILLDQRQKICAESYQKHTQHYPNPGWVEHNPLEIWNCIQDGVADVLAQSEILPSEIAAVGLANQGETVMFWDEKGSPLYPAIVWSCRRSLEIANQWQADGNWNQQVIEKTGLRIDPYFSATKIRWMMKEVDEVKQAIRSGQVRCSTLDSWLMYKMSGGNIYATDASTAARTLLFNLHHGQWDQDILSYLGIKEDWLPQILPTVGRFGITDPKTFHGISAPIMVSVVDQPAALYGHLCVEPGMSKCTYGTGCFLYMNTGSKVPTRSSHGLLSSVVWKRDQIHTYALDGAVYSAGSAIEWGKDALKLYEDIDVLQEWSSKWIEQGVLAGSDKESFLREHSLVFCPALSGLATPYWNSEARGMFYGLSHHTNHELMARAILEGIAHRVADVLEAMEEETKQSVTVLKVDGGLTANPYLMQFQADLLGKPVQLTETKETTAMGVLFMLGESLGWWTQHDLQQANRSTKTYYPNLPPDRKELLRKRWKRIISFITQMTKME